MIERDASRHCRSGEASQELALLEDSGVDAEASKEPHGLR